MYLVAPDVLTSTTLPLNLSVSNSCLESKILESFNSKYRNALLFTLGEASVLLVTLKQILIPIVTKH